MVMSGIVRAPLFLSLLLSLAHCVEVIDFVPDPSANVEKRQISVKGPVRLRCIGPPAALSWQFEAGLEVSKAAKEEIEDDAKVLHFDVFDESMDGLYTCQRYETNEKKRMRVFFFDDVVPAGFHNCTDDQRSQCVHAKACRAADETNHISCVCMKDWQGERCETALLTADPILPPISGMSLVWIVFAVLVLVGIIVAVKCHNDDEKSELVPTTDPAEMV